MKYVWDFKNDHGLKIEQALVRARENQEGIVLSNSREARQYLESLSDRDYCQSKKWNHKDLSKWLEQ